MTAAGLDMLQAPKDVHAQPAVSDSLANHALACQTSEGQQQFKDASACIKDTAQQHLPKVDFNLHNTSDTSAGETSGTAGGSFSEKTVSGWDTKTWRDPSGKIIEKDMKDSTGHEINTSYKYDAQTGNMTEAETSSFNKSKTIGQDHVEKFDATTGARISNVLTGFEVVGKGQTTTTESEYDPQTSKRTHDQTITPKARIEHDYNPITGVIESALYATTDGKSKVEDKYDEKGRKKSETDTDADGDEKEIVFDPSTQRKLYTS